MTFILCTLWKNAEILPDFIETFLKLQFNIVVTRTFHRRIPSFTQKSLLSSENLVKELIRNQIKRNIFRNLHAAKEPFHFKNVSTNPRNLFFLRLLICFQMTSENKGKFSSFMSNYEVTMNIQLWWISQLNHEKFLHFFTMY